jgi:hypothetical protein
MTESIAGRAGAQLQTDRIGGFRGYQQVRAVEERATLARGDGDEKLRAALERLGRFLSSGQPFRDDVPNGYYLNITV